MDILGPFPISASQRKFQVVAIDYFTKWVEVVATITPSKIKDFFNKSIIFRFGIPHVLITDNVKQFDYETFRDFCDDLNIELHFSSVAHPQTNGMIEVTNRAILQGLKKRFDQAKGLWADELYNILWAYRTTSQASTGKMPFSLICGTKVVIPIKK